MERIFVESRRIEGFRLRTSNAQEMNPDTAKIPDFIQHEDNFSDDHYQHKRRYATDFEFYDDPETVSIYIAVE